MQKSFVKSAVKSKYNFRHSARNAELCTKITLQHRKNTLINTCPNGIIKYTKILLAKESKYMKKIRILAVILAVLMLPLSLFIACDKNGGDTATCTDGDHSWGKRNVVSKRDCVNPEIIKRTCTVCGEVERTEKPAKGHSFDTAEYSDNNATCTEEGTKSKRCVSCGYREAVGTEPATGHTFVTYTKHDEFTEKSTCIRCGNAEGYRNIGIILDFEGEQTHPSYDRISVYSATEETLKTEGEGEEANSYLSIERVEGVIIGGSEFGVTIAPRADVLKGATLDTAPTYIVEFNIRITKDGTKDLVLLQGEKNGAIETFLTYKAEDGTIYSNIAPAYTLKDEDYGAWIKIAVCLNDGSKVYKAYVNNALISSTTPYLNQSSYFMGYDLDSLKVAMTSGTDASSFDIDNFKLYFAEEPDGYEGEVVAGYWVYTFADGSTFLCKVSTCEGSCSWKRANVAADCQTYRHTLKTCKNCGGQDIERVYDKKDHVWESETFSATCEVGEYTRQVCTTCNARNIVYNAEAGARGHKVDVNHESYYVKVPTCSEGGYTKGICERCGIDLIVDETLRLGHELVAPDAENGVVGSEDYYLQPLSCTQNQYATGKCVRYGQCGCDYVFTESDGEEYKKATGHSINKDPATGYQYFAPNCEAVGYSLGVCKNKGCDYSFGETDLTEEALGHSLVSNIKVVSGHSMLITTCTREGCNYKVSENVIATVPTAAQMKIYIADRGLGCNSIDVWNFESDEVGQIRGEDSLGLTTTAVTHNAFTLRNTTIVTKSDKYLDGNKYGELKVSANAPDGGVHARYDATFKSGTNSNDFVFEMSVRRRVGTDENLGIGIHGLERTTTSPNYHEAVYVQTNGNIVIASTKEVVGTIKEKDWTRISVVFHSNPDNESKKGRPTIDLYIDGVLIAQEITLGGTTAGSAFSTEFPNYTCASISVSGGDSARGKIIDIDEIYCYSGNVPVYMKEANGKNYTNMVFKDALLNSTTDAGVSYLNATLPEVKDAEGNITATAVVGALGENVTITTGANTVYSVANVGTEDAPKYGLSVKIGADQPTLPDAVADAVSSIRVGNLITHGKILFETDVRIAEGTSRFVLFGGYKNGGMTTKNEETGKEEEVPAQTCDFVYYENGKLYTHDGEEICEVTAGEWFTFAAIVDEYHNTYDVYVGGVLKVDNKAVDSAYNTQFEEKSVDGGKNTNLYHNIKKLEYVVFGACDSSATAKYDVDYINTGIYGRTSPIYVAE